MFRVEGFGEQPSKLRWRLSCFLHRDFLREQASVQSLPSTHQEDQDQEARTPAKKHPTVNPKPETLSHVRKVAVHCIERLADA